MKNKKMARTLIIFLLLLPTNILPAFHSFANANGLPKFIVINTVGQSTQRNKASEIYGRWKTAQNLRNYIVKSLQKEIDEENYLGDSSITDHILINKSSDIYKEMAIFEALKIDLKKLLENDEAFLVHSDFVKLSKKIANILNNDLGKAIFKLTDFVPREQDYPKGRDIVNTRLAVLLSQANIDIRYVVKQEDWHRLLTIWEWIDKVYIRVAPRGLSNVETPKSSSSSTALASIMREERKNRGISRGNNSSPISYESDFRDIVGCNSKGACMKEMELEPFVRWLKWCPYRSPGRRGIDVLNVADFEYFTERYGNGFAKKFQNKANYTWFLNISNDLNKCPTLVGRNIAVESNDPIADPETILVETFAKALGWAMDQYGNKNRKVDINEWNTFLRDKR